MREGSKQERPKAAVEAGTILSDGGDAPSSSCFRSSLEQNHTVLAPQAAVRVNEESPIERGDSNVTTPEGTDDGDAGWTGQWR
jgi:hypothetical protein